MIPIHLTLQGIYSYQEKQSIDFTRLTEANIFGIFGPVGSGKSTVLEAITYALYGRTDRLNLSGDDRNYNMMNLKSNELLIEFRFRTGKGDTEYMATVTGKRNSKQFDVVKAHDRAAYQRVNEQWQPIEVNSLDTIIGLSYENFKRTIIIPQNRFQEFLQLGNKERTQMMKELFNLEKYELYYKVVALESKNNQQQQNLDGQLQQLGDLNPEQVSLAEEGLKTIKHEIEQKAKELALQQEEEVKFRKLKELVGKLRETEQLLAQLKAQEPDFIRLDRSIREYDYCRMNFMGLLESAKEVSAKIAQFEQGITADNSLLTATLKQLTDIEASYEVVKKEFDGRELLKQQAEELGKIAKLNQLGVVRNHLNERISKGDKIYSDTVEKANQLKVEYDLLAVSLKETRAQQPDMALLSKMRDWFTVNNLHTSSLKEVNLELVAVQTEMEAIEKQKSLLWEDKCFDGILPTNDFKEIVAQLEDRKVQIKDFINQLSMELEHLALQSKLQEYATNLEEGRPCPLCGALSHPEPLTAQSVSEAQAQARNQRSVHEKEIVAIEQGQKQLSEIATKLQLKRETLDRLLGKQKEQAAKVAEHQTLFVWEAYRDERTITTEFSKAEQLQLQIKEKEAEQEKFAQRLEDENRNKEKYGKAVEEFRHQLTANSTESSTLSSQITLFQISEFETNSSDEIETRKNILLKQYRDVEAAYETTLRTLTTLRKESDTITGRLEANRKTLEQERTVQQAVGAKISAQLEQSEYSSIVAVEKILAQPMDVEREKKKVDDFRHSLDFSQKQLAAFNTEMGDQKYDAQQHQVVLLSIASVSEELKVKNQSQGKLESDLKKLKADLDTQKSLRELADRLQARGEDIKTLKQLFKASGFVNYISSVYLQELCHAANGRFYKLTRQKLSLEVTDDNNFQVRDFMNGGKVRNVKTLSGGQTFQAALSLALALADNIQKITDSNQNFFFLDEGFGSLDKDSLETVFDTLKSLRKENRIVGVISHVEEMQQEIDAHLKIVNDEERGSLIRTSWS